MFSSADIPSSSTGSSGSGLDITTEAVALVTRPMPRVLSILERNQIQADSVAESHADQRQSQGFLRLSADSDDDLPEGDQGPRPEKFIELSESSSASEGDDEAADVTYVLESDRQVKRKKPQKAQTAARNAADNSTNAPAVPAKTASINPRLRHLTTAIHHNDSAEVLRYADPRIVNTPCQHVKGFEGFSPFIMSLWNGNADIIHTFLHRGADIYFRLHNSDLKEHGFGIAALTVFWQCTKSLHSIYHYLLQARADAVTEFTNTKVLDGVYAGYTPLMFACMNDDEATVNMLLRHGARVHTVANDGATASSLAKNSAIIALLEVHKGKQSSATEISEAAEEEKKACARLATSSSSSSLAAVLHQKRDVKAARHKQSLADLRQKQKAATENLRAYVKRLEDRFSAREENEAKVSASSDITMRHQYKAIREYTESRVKFLAGEKTNPHAVFEFPTGSGKTYIFNKIAAESDEVTLIIVSRENLLEQTRESFREYSPGVTDKIGVMRSAENGGTLNKKNIHALFDQKKIIITTYKSLEMYHHHIPKVKVAHLALDEGHNALSEQRGKLVQKFKDAGSFVSAFTATPVRDVVSTRQVTASCYKLLDHADEKSNPITPLETTAAIDIGVNVPIVTARFELKPIHNESLTILTDGYHISEKNSQRVFNKPEYNKAIVDFYLNGEDHVSGKSFRGDQSVAFCSGIDHAIALANEFNRASVNAVDATGELREKYGKNVEEKYYKDEKQKFERIPENRDKVFRPGVDCPVFSAEQKQATRNKFCVAKAVYSNVGVGENRESLDSKECQDILEQYKLGGILVLTGADKLTEGFDCKSTSLIFKARATLSRIVNKQSAGRGSRPDPKNPNKICYVFDFQAGDTIALNFSDCLERDGKPQATWGRVDEYRASHQRNAQPAIPVFEDGKSRADYCNLRWDAPAELTHNRIRLDRQQRKEAKRQQRQAEREEHQHQRDARRTAKRQRKEQKSRAKKQAQLDKKRARNEKARQDESKKRVNFEMIQTEGEDAIKVDNSLSVVASRAQTQISMGPSFFSSTHALFSLRGSLHAHLPRASESVQGEDDTPAENEEQVSDNGSQSTSERLEELSYSIRSILTSHAVISIKRYLSLEWNASFAALNDNPLSVSHANKLALGLLDDALEQRGLGSRSATAKQILKLASEIAELTQAAPLSHESVDRDNDEDEVDEMTVQDAHGNSSQLDNSADVNAMHVITSAQSTPSLALAPRLMTAASVLSRFSLMGGHPNRAAQPGPVDGDEMNVRSFLYRQS